MAYDLTALIAGANRMAAYLEAGSLPERDLRAEIDAFVRKHYAKWEEGVCLPHEVTHAFLDSLSEYIARREGQGESAFEHAGIEREIHHALGFSDTTFVRSMSRDYSVYVRDASSSEVMKWVETRLRDLKQKEALLPGQLEYDGMLGGKKAIVRISSTKDKASVSWLRLEMFSPDLDGVWAAEIDLARELFSTLKKETRCSPGEKRPSDSMDRHAAWSISERGERLISWK